MFNFLKKLFKAKEEDVEIEKLEQWFKDKVEPIYSNLNEQLKEQISSIPYIIKAIKQDAAELENASIKDEEKVEPKVKQIVLGNRKNYIRILNQFADSIELPDAINAKTSLMLCSDINKDLDELSKNTQKTYYTVQHLFADNVEKIAKDIKDLAQISKAVKAIIEKNNVAKIEEIKADIQNLIKSINKKHRLEQEFIESKKRLEKSKKLRQEAETKIINLRNSSEYAEFNRLKEEHNEIKQKIHNAKNNIIELFSSLTPALKKYQRIALENEELIGRYAENPTALLEDRNLDIIPILQKMKSSILADAIDLRDKKKERALEKIGQITIEQLKLILSGYDKLKGREGILNDKLKAAKITPLIEEAQYKLEHHTEMVEKIKKDIIKSEEDIKNIDIEDMKKNVKEKIKRIINIEVKLLSSNP